ncbi:AraC family transcriptional regulator [Aquimarina litoralis]|uniref:AraC family transcriptional regulator n=1 Tax=Aquimarina litoralis TaxID=584605 RepID=UPI001C5771D9|nr:AraC family transcriptional regulator [Aquimarina litoralis]MBW1295010.1 helix-turn-helix domain-containing protein [Aquimarina litoralis]
MNETRQEYLKRINFVLDFIENNLDTDLSLEYLSKKANYSPFHFHRVFLAVVNERLNEFIIRKRIERIASIILVTPNIQLKDVIYRYGFNSDSSFSRAFKKYYGVSPTKFRSKGKTILSKIGIEPFSSEKYICSIDNNKQWMKMNAQITIKEIPELKLASISHIGEFDEIGNMFQKLMEWGYQKGVLHTSNFKAITLYHDNPNVTETPKVRFSTCVTIKEDLSPEEEIRQITLEKGIYIVGHFEIKAEEISKAWKNMCIWVIENGYEFRDGDFFEMYHNDHTSHPEQKFIVDICIPIEKTENVRLNKVEDIALSDNQSQNKQSAEVLDYHSLIGFMKEMRSFFSKEYETYFKLGNVYQGSPDYSYFSLTTEELKKQKLKFVIVLSHKNLNFSICLSGQNKSIRKKYWRLFKDSDWDKYHLAASIDSSLSIMDHIIIKEPNFNNKKGLIKNIEQETMKFIKELNDILLF